MSEHDETLRAALEENSRLRSEREESVREASSREFSGRFRSAERIFWAYIIACIVVGVSAINVFTHSSDIKTLIGSTVIILVVYETTVLLKLWFAMAGMKMSVLKEVKLLRLESARLATKVGVESSAEPSVKYELMRGVTRWERKLWLVACIFAALAASTWTRSQFEESVGSLSDDTCVTLAADGSAVSVSDITQTFHGSHTPKNFSFRAPKDNSVRFIDPEGQDMPAEITPADTHDQYEVTLSDNALFNGEMQHTRISEVPHAATLQDGVWTYESDIEYGPDENRFSVTICLPGEAKVISATPVPQLTFSQDGRIALRFQATRGTNEKFAYAIRYELPSMPD